MCRVRLHQTISEIMSQPLLYVRDIIPRDCLECVSKLNQVGFYLVFNVFRFICLLQYFASIFAAEIELRVILVM